MLPNKPTSDFRTSGKKQTHVYLLSQQRPQSTSPSNYYFFALLQYVGPHYKFFEGKKDPGSAPSKYIPLQIGRYAVGKPFASQFCSQKNWSISSKLHKVKFKYSEWRPREEQICRQQRWGESRGMRWRSR